LGEGGVGSSGEGQHGGSENENDYRYWERGLVK